MIFQKLINGDLFRTIKRDFETKEIVPLDLEESLFYEKGYYSPIDITTANQQNYVAIKMQSERFLIKDKPYRLEKECTVDINITDKPFYEIIGQFKLNKNSLNSNEAIIIARTMTAQILGIQDRSFIYKEPKEIIFRDKINNLNLSMLNEIDYAEVLTSIAYFALVDTIAEGRVNKGKEYNIFKFNLEVIDRLLSIGNLSTPQAISVYKKLFHFLNLIYTKWIKSNINPKITSISKIDVSEVQSYFNAIFDEVKDLIINLTGSALSINYYMNIKYLCDFMLNAEDAWIELLKTAIKDDFYLKYVYPTSSASMDGAEAFIHRLLYSAVTEIKQRVIVKNRYDQFFDTLTVSKNNLIVKNNIMLVYNEINKIFESELARVQSGIDITKDMEERVSITYGTDVNKKSIIYTNNRNDNTNLDPIFKTLYSKLGELYEETSLKSGQSEHPIFKVESLEDRTEILTDYNLQKFKVDYYFTIEIGLFTDKNTGVLRVMTLNITEPILSDNSFISKMVWR